MKKKELIKKIAEEFDLEEIKVSEYFDNIFETLAITFAKNKNVNISEFGKFKVKTKLSEDGVKQKTVLFSPVKKFANDVNYNFNELSPVQIRVLDDKDRKFKVGDEEYSEDEVEEIILIDFDEERVTESENPPEEILIPEETKQEILHEEIPREEKTEKTEEEILIPEETVHEVSEEIIPEEITEERKQEVIPGESPVESQIKDRLEVKEESSEVFNERDKILRDLTKIRFPEIKFEDFDEKIELPEIISKDKKIVSEVISIIKPEVREEVIPHVTEEKEEERTEKIEEPEIIDAEEEIISIALPEFTTEEKKEEIKTPKTSLELEAELLKMLDERKKILEEIKKLEDVSEDDLVDINEAKDISSEEKPNLFEENTLDVSKQNIFIDENGKVLENLLKDFVIHEDIQKETEETKEIPKELTEEEIINFDIKDEHSEEIIENVGKEKTDEDIDKDFEWKEDFKEVKYTENKDLDDLENLFGSIYNEHEDGIILPESKEVEPQMNNPEMKIFDKLLDEPIKQENIVSAPPVNNVTDDNNKNSMSFNELENMFVNFKTEKTEEVEPSKNEDTILPVKKTDTIKTYDDIFNLLEPNGKKKEVKPKEVIEEKPNFY
ncbi:MAG: HU family DNA-binding protein [Ignavibacteriae bacterium]|nr:HU family DNA-binding protein [Ignavibacteriota bacterium]